MEKSRDDTSRYWTTVYLLIIPMLMTKHQKKTLIKAKCCVEMWNGSDQTSLVNNPPLLGRIINTNPLKILSTTTLTDLISALEVTVVCALSVWETNKFHITEAVFF